MEKDKAQPKEKARPGKKRGPSRTALQAGINDERGLYRFGILR
jgi:hypothetical protein